ncbi:hypothetical protein ACFV16_22425 [Streptomyces massasporeus]|uniref:hypothetical protein n=1 Tax=Streptomyces massasporeus TaxID=67324 RepID=UPI0036A51BA2
MTKEQAAYAAALNLAGSDVLDPKPGGQDGLLVGSLGMLRRAALHSTGPHADCSYCWYSTPCGGPLDGEHFADLWEHLIVRHGLDTWVAEAPAQMAWIYAVQEFEGAKAA